MIYKTLRRASLPAGIALILASPLAFAQETETEDATTLDRIEVTGSNIPRTQLETSSPVQVISR
ncbi:MAG TPA: hypothetical protein VFH12_08295, partial [Pseudoxanthomonas sp.]|nr:hypothetical protein [Pseudoxanthomonas sp.]